MRRLLNRLALLAATASVAVAGPAAVAHAEFGVTPEHFKTDLAGAEAGLAGAPADYQVNYQMNQVDPANPSSAPDGTAKQVEVELPAGLIGNPTGIPACAMAQVTSAPFCPAERAIGSAGYRLYEPANGFFLPPLGFPPFNARIFRVQTQGNEAAAFAFSVFNSYPIRIGATVDPSNAYRIRTTVKNVNEGLVLASANLTFWGIPQEHSAPGPLFEIGSGTAFGEPQPLSMPRTRFFSTPTNCERTSLETTMTLTSWQTKQPIAPVGSAMAGVTGCDELSFDPTINVTPENDKAGAPSGYKVEVTVPQNEDPYGRQTPNLKNAVVHLPAGLAISPPQAQGLDACTDEQLGLHTAAPAACPEASKIGSMRIDTPLLEEPLSGSVYIGSQLSSDPESGQMYRIFLVANGPGTLIKLSGAVSVDAKTGQVTATFDENPELPFSKFTLDLKGGDRASLVNPSTCGTYTTTTSLSSWAGQVVTPQSSFTIDQNCDHSGFTPGFVAGTADPAAGQYSSFSLRVTRPEGQQDVSRIDATLPDGLLAKLAGIPLCGGAQAASGNCPAASQVGTTTVGVGEGAAPLYVPQAGKSPTAVYLAGPYKGGPYSLVIKVPAQAGPFDLGTVAVRTALQIDPVTTQVTAKSDALPQILGGVPLAYRDIVVNINRSGFILNPTSCEPMSVGGTITSAAGKSASVSNAFQTVNCADLGFEPKLALRLSGAPPRRGANPALKATLTPANGNANIGKASVILPATELLEQAHIKTVCTRVQFAANECPAGSIYGHARAWTPLLDTPLEGPVYLRSNGGERKLPDLVADLNGSIHVVLVGYIDSVKRHGSPRIRTRFLSVPDAPVSRFVLEMQKGKKSLLANNTNLCKAKPRAEAALGGQNGKDSETRPLVKVSGCGGKKSKAGKKGK